MEVDATNVDDAAPSTSGTTSELSSVVVGTHVVTTAEAHIEFPDAAGSAMSIIVTEKTEIEVDLAVKWGTKELDLRLTGAQTVGDIKRALEALTGVLPSKQKLLGLSKGRLPADSTPISQLALRPKTKVVLIGTPEESFLKAQLQAEDIPIVLDDLDMDYNPSLAAVHLCQASLAKTIQNAEIVLIKNPREGKKLLVLDIDHTIMDFASAAITVSEMKRPGLDAFLEAVYPHYDLAIWSHTSWRWLELKLTEMGMLDNPKYSISFVLDKTVMFPVETTLTTKKGDKHKHHVKPLELIWSKLPRYYNRRNTVHVDDLAHNFALNAQNGLKIAPFRATMAGDTVLSRLQKYLIHIASHDDLSSFVHNDWETYIVKRQL